MGTTGPWNYETLWHPRRYYDRVRENNTDKPPATFTLQQRKPTQVDCYCVDPKVPGCRHSIQPDTGLTTEITPTDSRQEPNVLLYCLRVPLQDLLLDFSP
ncbi:hypothetical protein AV530_005668 [Patagioenas fasciata monilis]|uniref:Uncharacterized protein n=1 Tax=Patagioenas fasciata monilis TaxID=372326 RepID=A0A1V4JM70_PATFA|nr:hypothetical protein AV530_005668 [Patagioenas fasciata monilis]